MNPSDSTASSSFSADYAIQVPAPVTSSPTAPSVDLSSANIPMNTPVQDQYGEKKKRGLSYPLLGLLLLFAGIVLAGQQYGLGDILPYPLSGLIAAGLVVLVALWMIARGWIGKFLSVIVGLLSVGLIAYMITDVVSPGLLPVSGTWNMSFSYQQASGGISVYVATTGHTASSVASVSGADTLSGDTIMSGTVETGTAK